MGGCKGCGEGPVRMRGAGSHPEDHGHEHGTGQHAVDHAPAHDHTEVPVYIRPTELKSEYVWAKQVNSETDTWDVEAMLCSTDIRFTLTVPGEDVRAAMSDLERVARSLRDIKQFYKERTATARALQEAAE